MSFCALPGGRVQVGDQGVRSGDTPTTCLVFLDFEPYHCIRCLSITLESDAAEQLVGA